MKGKGEVFLNHLKLKAASLLFSVVLLAGCGLTDEKITMKPETGENIQVTLDRGDDFMEESSRVFVVVYQKKKVMMRCAFISRGSRNRPSGPLSLPCPLKSIRKRKTIFPTAWPAPMAW